MKKDMTRRTFLKGTGLVVGVAAVSSGIGLFNVSTLLASNKKPIKFDALLDIAPDETVTIWTGQTELGQGTHTGLAMIVAEELEADWNRVQVKQALAGKDFYDPVYKMQMTAGSGSIRHNSPRYHQVGAAAREMLIKAAAREWNIPATKCRAKMGKVVGPNGQSMTFGKLAPKAAKLTPPKKPKLKDPKDYKIIGTKRARLDIPAKVQGTTIFGVDVKVAKMCVAAVARPPRFGAKPESYNTSAAKSVPGVLQVVPFEDKVAVCAETTHAALQGREKLNVKWSRGTHPDLNDEILHKMFVDALAKPGLTAVENGDAKGSLSKAAKTVEAKYFFPYVAHCTLEPMNCTASVEKDRCRIWVPTQGQTWAQNAAANVTGLPPEKIELATTYCGGGFGRRVGYSVVIDAVTLSKKVGRPVQVFWNREDDFKYDEFRPAVSSHVQGGLDSKGNATALSAKVATQSLFTGTFDAAVVNGVDFGQLDGIANMNYKFPNSYISYIRMDLPIKKGFWRSVAMTCNAYIVESFIDEMAVAAGKDPVEFRLNLMEKGSRQCRALELVADKANWGGKVASGRGRGVACGSCFGSSAAHVAEVSVDQKTGNVKVHKVTAAIDCGPAFYPDAIRAQLEGAVVMGLSMAMKEQVHFAKGGVQTANFDDYPLLTMTEVPEIEIHISKSRHKVGGVGEPGTPTVLPATANAIANATGVRLRELPFDTEKLKKI